MAIYKVPDNILIEYKKLLCETIKDFKMAEEFVKLKPKEQKIFDKYKKQLKVLEDNYGI